MTEAQQKRQGRIATLALGWPLFLLGIYIMIFLGPDVVRSLSGPVPTTLADAAAVATETSRYVTITDGEWECDTIQVVRGRSSSTSGQTDRLTEVFLTNAGGEVVVLVSMSGRWDCDELSGVDPLSGYLERATEDLVQDLTNEVRLARFINREHVLELCGYCGTANSAGGLIASVIMILIGGAFVYTGHWVLRDKPES